MLDSSFRWNDIFLTLISIPSYRRKPVSRRIYKLGGIPVKTE